ncbi:MAG: NUDIX domain-containing protein [Nanoarchaeota archaeon]
MVERNQAAVVVPITSDKKVFLQRKDLGYPWNPGMWCFFGGKIEQGKSDRGADTLTRELFEELGIELKGVKYFGSRPYFDIRPSDGRRREGALEVYTANFDNGRMSQVRLKEGAGMSLYERSEIWGLHMVPHNKDILLEVFRSLPQ